MSKGKDVYIHSRFLDLTFIQAPPYVVLGVLGFLDLLMDIESGLHPLVWLVVVLGVDVSHVYSSIYRSYLDRQILKKYRFQLLATPLFCWIAAFAIYESNSLYFWRFLAYVAVFHFVRQQYGIFMIYARKGASTTTWKKKLDVIVIYASTLYPIIDWHLSGNKNFVWFVKDDFFMVYVEWLLTPILLIYIGVVFIYMLFEFYFWRINPETFVFTKNLFLLGTAISWYFSIVYFNSDFVFTLLNVISHGVPYIALLWASGNKATYSRSFSAFLKYVFSVKGMMIFLLIILILAFLEESLWDAFIWNDHPQFFGFLPFWGLNIGQIEAFVVATLTLPQFTHYIIDGYIWRRGVY